MTAPRDSAPDSPAAVVRAFYRAVNDRDGDALGALIDHTFDPDVVLELPPSLPYGGRVESARRVRRMFTAMTRSTARVGPDAVQVVTVVDGGHRVVAQLAFDWYAPGTGDAVASGALEIWTFVDGRVREIRAFYWDTAALVALMKEEGA